MYTHINFSRFRDLFNHMSCERPFSYKALEFLFNYLEEREVSLGEEIELDLIAVCGEFREINNYDNEYSAYVGDNAHLGDRIMTHLYRSILVRQ